MTNYEQWVAAAARLAQHLHQGQRDKAGQDYFVGHLSAVAGQGRTWLEQMLGYLHDTTEDTPHTTEQVLSLLEAEAGDSLPYSTRTELANALNLLNHNNYPERAEYIRAIATSPLATAVKLNDLRHNMDISRLPDPQPKDYARLERYRSEYEFLLSQQG